MGFKPGLRVLLVVLYLSTAWAAGAAGVPGGPSGEPLPPRIRALLHHRSAPLRDDGGTPAQARRLAGEKAPAALDAILVMCDFSDSLMFGRYGQVDGEFPPPMQSEFYYDAHDSLYFDHLMQDVADYYADVSAGQFTLNFTVHPRTINLPYPMGFIGNHPQNGEQPVVMTRDVVDSLDAEIDFSLYDTVILIHAGAGEETDILGNSPEQIYSNFLDGPDFEEAVADSVLDNPWIPSAHFPEGEGIDKVLILPETEYQDPVGGFGGFFGSLGVYCFEVGLRLGMLSLSDFTPSGSPDSQGIGEFGLMGYGLFVGLGWIPPHPCAFNKQFMGWLDPVEVDPLAYRAEHLTPAERTGDPQACLRVPISGQEYWLLAYRLQDPDGNRIFTHPGDLNGNNIPDFYDADSAYGDGTPTGVFDRETDVRERLLGCEWDFFMSENNARVPWEKGAGSGVYVWHIDEGVIRDVFDSESNLFNADPAHKSVDLEEADGIQDLDSREPSDFMLGGDDDSFRGEDASAFGWSTVPDTRTALGARTGVVFSDFSNVVLDSQVSVIGVNDAVSPPDTLWTLQYADTLRFNVFTEYDTAGGPVLTARRTFAPGVNLSGSHVLTGNLDLAGNDEIILAGVYGNIFVLDGDLNEFLDRDDDPATFNPFVRGLEGGRPVLWNQPAALGDIDHDGQPEIVLTSPQGVYAFNADATPVRDLGPSELGLYVGLVGGAQPAVLVPADGVGDYDPTAAVNVCVVEDDGKTTSVNLYGGPGGSLVKSFPQGSFEVTAPPVFMWDRLIVTVTDSVLGVSEVRLIDPAGMPDPTLYRSFELDGVPGPHAPLAGLVDPDDPDTSLRFLMIIGADGRGETVVFDADLRRAMDNVLWPADVRVTAGPVPGGALTTGDGLGRMGHNGGWLDGWPVPVADAADPDAGRAAPGALVALLTGDALPLSQYILSGADGRIFGYGTRAEQGTGWPVSGPARVAGTPALGRVTGEETLDLVAVGTFGRLLGVNAATGNLGSRPESTVALFESAAADSGVVWPMWGGSPWRNGAWDVTAGWAPPGAADGTGIVAGSHRCYPGPLGDGPLFVRGSLRAPGRVQVVIHNLEGEEMVRTGWQSVSARDPFVVEVDLPSAVTGLYLCRLVAENGGAVDVSVKQFAVVR